jgi:hypothetical protein
MVPPVKETGVLLIKGNTLFLLVFGLTRVPEPTVTTREGVAAAMRRPGAVNSLLILAKVESICVVEAEFN